MQNNCSQYSSPF